MTCFKKFFKRKFKKNTLLFTVVTLTNILLFTIIYIISNVPMVASAVRNLSLRTSQQANYVNYLNSNLLHDLKLYTRSDAMKNLDFHGITELSTLILSDSEVFNSLIVIDDKNTIVYGYTDNFKELVNGEAVRLAQQGIVGSSDMIKDGNNYFIDIAAPIYGDNKNIRGVLVLRLLRDNVKVFLNGDRLDEDMEAFIVDEEGIMLTPSKYISDAVGKTKVNMEKMKLSIDYNAEITYFNYRNQEVYGSYYEIPDTGWTIFLEKEAESANELKNKIINLFFINMIVEIFVIVIVEKLYLSYSTWYDNKENRKKKRC